MFGHSKRSVFKPSVYETSTRRRGRRVPRWLVILLLGVILGAAGLLFLQTSYGPQRLSVLESQQLTNKVDTLKQDQQRLQSELNATAHDLALTREARAALSVELTQAKSSIAPLQEDIAHFAAVMPADPRGGPIGVNAGIFTRQNGQLGYHVLLMQDEPANQAFTGTLTMAVEGRYANGRTQTLTLDALEVSLTRYQHFKGLVALPDGFTPLRVTVRVLDAADRQRAMRILIVRGS